MEQLLVTNIDRKFYEFERFNITHNYFGKVLKQVEKLLNDIEANLNLELIRKIVQFSNYTFFILFPFSVSMFILMTIGNIYIYIIHPTT